MNNTFIIQCVNAIVHCLEMKMWKTKAEQKRKIADARFIRRLFTFSLFSSFLLKDIFPRRRDDIINTTQKFKREICFFFIPLKKPQIDRASSFIVGLPTLNLSKPNGQNCNFLTFINRNNFFSFFLARFCFFYLFFFSFFHSYFLLTVLVYLAIVHGYDKYSCLFDD